MGRNPWLSIDTHLQRPLQHQDVFWHALHVFVWFARQISVF